MKCKLCGDPLRPNENKCRSCGTWTFEEEKPATAGQVVLSASNDFGAVSLEDVISADEDRLATGPWDICFGSAEKEDGTIGLPGVVRGSVNLVGGSPGAGKSTLFLQMAMNVIIASHFKELVLYISGEEQLPQIKSRAVRLRIPPEVRRMIKMVDVRKGGADIAAILKHFKFILLFLDSLDAISGKDLMLEVEMTKVVKEYSTFQHAPAIVSKQVTKEDAIAGLMALQHEGDATFTFFPDPGRIVRTEKDPLTIKAETEAIRKGLMSGPLIPYIDEAVRILETQKNRNGPAFVTRELLMTSRGLVPYEDTEEEEDEESDEEE